MTAADRPNREEQSIRIPLPDGRSVTGIWTLVAEPSPRWCFVYAPGAGSKLDDGFGVFAAQHLAGCGIPTLRFQFPYMEEGRRLPDRAPALEATWCAEIEVARPVAPSLVIGGRSMGGRIASQVVAEGAVVEALALFAYPLHQPGHPDRPRDAHLPQIGIPTLFCSGTHDAFATPEELEVVAARLPRATLHLMEVADHSFAVPKRSGRGQADVWAEAVEAFTEWLQTL